MNKTKSAQPPARKRTGRIGKYEQWLTDDGLLLLQGWARAGLTDEQIAHNCGITTVTLRQWKGKYASISAALKDGKEVIDLMVENALLKRALGFSYTETTTETSDKNGTTVRVVEKYAVPDTTAQIFWLKNRKRLDWRDNERTEIERERLELDKRKVEADLQEKTDNQARTIEVIISDQAKEWGK